MLADLAVTVFALFARAESVIRLQSPTSPLKFNYIEPLLEPKCVLNLLIFDPKFLDLAEHSFVVLVNQISKNEFTSWTSNETKPYDRSNYVDIALLGLKPIEVLNNSTRLLCVNSTTAEYNLKRLPRCPLAMSEKFIVLAAASNRAELDDITEDDKNTLGHLTHALLFLWYVGADDVRAADILCLHRVGLNPPNLLTLACNFSNIDERGSCIEHAFEKYLNVLALPAPCYTDTVEEPENVSTPFHKSSHASLNFLQCEQNESLYSTWVTDWLISAEGNYPSHEDFLLLSQSQPYYVITSDKTFVAFSSSKNPYLSPFDRFTWVSIGASFTAFIVVAVVVLHFSGKSVCHSLGSATAWVIGAFLDQIRVDEGAKERIGVKCYMRRLLLLSLTIPATFLTNHYRSALHSEFAVTDENYLSIDGIEALGDFKLFLLLEGKECEDFQGQLVKLNDTAQAGMETCLRSMDNGECLFFRQAILSTVWSEHIGSTTNSSYRDRLANVDRIYRNMSFACVDELDEILSSANDLREKQAFVASYDIVDLAWTRIEKETMGRNPAVKFYYKQDAEDSFFISPNGFTFGMNLGSNQVWVRRSLRSLFESGIQLLWARWERWDSDQRLGKMLEIYVQTERKENPITLENSWILAVLLACMYLMGIAFAVFLLELSTKAT